jgi:hypothetical protein
MATSFKVARDKHFDSVKYGSDESSYHQYKNITYADNWVAQTDLVTGSLFKVQIVANGNTVTFSWNTIHITANGSGAVTTLTFATKIPKNLIPNLVASPGDGQNFPIYVNTSTHYIIWIDTDGTVRIDPTEGNLAPIAPLGGGGTVFGGSVTWTTNN